MKRWIIALVGLILIQACANNQNELKHEAIIIETIDSAINYFSFNELDSAILIHTEFYPDNAKILSIGKIKSEIDREMIPLVEKLEEKLKDSVLFKFHEFKFKNNLIIENNANNEGYFSHPNYFGTINISDPAISTDGKFACYYLGINCDEDCSRGFLVITGKANEKWRVKKQIQVWRNGGPI